MPSELRSRLRALYRRPAPGQREHQETHEDALVAAMARRSTTASPVRGGSSEARGSGGGIGRWLGLPRFALAGALGLAVVVGACVMPAEYPVRLGYGLEITVASDRFGGVEGLDPEAIGRWLAEDAGLEHVELMVLHHRAETTEPSGTASTRDELRLRLYVAGDGVDPEALMDELRERFPVLADAELHDAPLSGMVHGTLGGKLSHDLLDLTIDRHGVQEAERQILEQLRSDGIDLRHATIDITHEQGADGMRRIEVRVETER